MANRVPGMSLVLDRISCRRIAAIACVLGLSFIHSKAASMGQYPEVSSGGSMNDAATKSRLPRMIHPTRMGMVFPKLYLPMPMATKPRMQRTMESVERESMVDRLYRGCLFAGSPQAASGMNDQGQQ